ncbi:phosphatase PAP2 family protein [Micromonospora sediminicola]|uniref:phosphatase PAP2 family protein n=1 Tax=Micromonospora sediminicola TaxID=946078 RepID=UPI0033CD8BEA
MTSSRRLMLAVLILTVGAGAVAALAPGGLGDPQPEVVTEGVSADLYRAVVGVPAGVVRLGEHAALGAPLLLLAALAWVGWVGRRRRTGATAVVALTGAGAVLAYVTSEALKLVVDQERPCRAIADVPGWVPCPPAGDWSFPSNHSTVAGALATGLVLAAPRLAGFAVPAGLLAAAARVVAGVHYPHDVVAGLLLGTAVTAAVVVLLTPAVRRPVGSTRDRCAPGRPAR